MDLRGRRLLILGGSRFSLEIIRHARAMGIVTGVTDWYPLEKSPAKQEADEAYYVSTADIDAMEQLVREQKFDGIFTGFTDSVLPYYADICDRTGLPCYGTRKQFEIFTDKEKYKALMREYGVPTIPEYQIGPDGGGCMENEIPYPVIVKPADGSGSRGIRVCRDPEELQKALSSLREKDPGREIVIEQYLDLPEATVFWFFDNGQYYMTLLGNRHVKHNQEGELPLPAGYTYPSAVQPRFLRETAPLMEKMFRSQGILNGMMFMQCKVIGGTLCVYDIGYRLTGTLEYINLKALCGYDPMDMLIRFALTGETGEPDLPGKADPYLGGRYGYNVSLLCKPGKVAEISGLDRVRALPGVLDVVTAHPEGDTITQEMKGLLAQITVRILGQADTVEDMKREIRTIQDTVRVISDTGEDMILPGMDDTDFEGTVYEKN